MRRVAIVLLMVGALFLAAPTANAVPRHEHDLTTPNEKTHAIATGLSHNAPCTAFVNFHEIVHLGVFVGGNNPLSLTPTFIEGEC